MKYSTCSTYIHTYVCTYVRRTYIQYNLYICTYILISKSNISSQNLALFISILNSLHSDIIWSSSRNRRIMAFNIFSLASLGLTVDNISLKKASSMEVRCSLIIPIVVTWSSGNFSSNIG